MPRDSRNLKNQLTEIRTLTGASSYRVSSAPNSKLYCKCALHITDNIPGYYQG